MLTSIRGLVAASLFAGALVATPAFADETDPPAAWTVSGNVTGVTDYRWRGLSYSGGDFAIDTLELTPLGLLETPEPGTFGCAVAGLALLALRRGV